MRHEFTDGAPQRRFANEDHAVQARVFDGAYESLGVGVQVRTGNFVYPRGSTCRRAREAFVDLTARGPARRSRSAGRVSSAMYSGELRECADGRPPRSRPAALERRSASEPPLHLRPFAEFDNVLVLIEGHRRAPDSGARDPGRAPAPAEGVTRSVRRFPFRHRRIGPGGLHRHRRQEWRAEGAQARPRAGLDCGPLCTASRLTVGSE